MDQSLRKRKVLRLRKRSCAFAALRMTVHFYGEGYIAAGLVFDKISLEPLAAAT